MADALAQLDRYVRLVVDVDIAGSQCFRVEHDATGVWGVDTRLRPDQFPQLTESAFAQLICGPRHLGLPPIARAVQVTHPQPPYHAEYQRVLGVPVTFAAARNAFQVDPTLLGQRVERLPRYAFGVLTRHADALLTALERATSTRGEVERVLLPLLHTDAVTMNAVAGRLNVSRQTLYRRLKREGVTFERILDELRHRMAMEYLGGRKVSIQETAYLVGFSEPAAFSRAFKRWTGSSPRDFARA